MGREPICLMGSRPTEVLYNFSMENLGTGLERNWIKGTSSWSASSCRRWYTGVRVKFSLCIGWHFGQVCFSLKREVVNKFFENIKL